MIRDEKTAAWEGPREGRKEKIDPVIVAVDIAFAKLFLSRSGNEISWGHIFSLLRIDVINEGIPNNPVSRGSRGFLMDGRLSVRMPRMPDVMKI